MDVQEGTSPNNAEQHYTIVPQPKLAENYQRDRNNRDGLVNRRTDFELLFIPLALASGISTPRKRALA